MKNFGLKNIKQKFDIRTLILIVALIICVISAVLLLEHLHHQRENDQKMEDLSKEVTKEVKEPEEPKEELITGQSRIDFEKLQAANPDVIGWIRVPGTHVDDPIMQSGDDKAEDYYLEHGWSQNYDPNGLIYMQKVNSKEFTDPDTLIYGHNIINGFRTLHNYEDQFFFDENRYIYIYTPEEEYIYEIFAAKDTDDKLITAYYDNFADKTVFKSYLDEILHAKEVDASAIIKEDMELTEEDHIITLSTCTKIHENRFIVLGRLLSNEENQDLRKLELEELKNINSEGETTES